MCLCMMFSVIPVAVFAAGDDDSTTAVTDERIVELSEEKTEILITMDFDSFVYDGNPAAPIFYAYMGINGDRVSVDTDNSFVVEYKLNGADDSEYSTEKPFSAGKYDVKVTREEDDTYNYVSIFFRFDILKADPVYIVPNNLKATYGQTLNDINLPFGFSWSVKSPENVVVGNIGKNTFNATFTPTDTVNYNTVSDIRIVIEVTKANPDYKVPTGLTANYGDFLDYVSLPRGFSWDLNYPESITVGDVGTNIFKATFTPDDTANYNIIDGIEVEVTVNKIAPTYEVPTGLTATYGDYLHSVALPKGFGWDASYNRSTTVGDAGTNTFKVTFTPEDTANYNTVENIEAEIVVSKASPTVDAPVIAQVENKLNLILSDVVIPANGWAWTDSTQSVINGEKYTATYTPADTVNYQTVSASIKVVVTACNHEGTEGIKATHIDATCKSEGRYTEICRRCGTIIVDNILPTIEHNFGDWVSDGNAKFFHDGTKTHTCLCGETETVADKKSAKYNNYLTPDNPWIVRSFISLLAKFSFAFYRYIYQPMI